MAKTVIKGLSKSQGVTLTPYAPGWYELVIAEAEDGSSRNGNQMVTVRATIGSTFPVQPDKRNLEGKRYTHRFTIMDEHPFMLDRFKDFLNAAGVRVDSGDGFVLSSVVGKKVWGQMQQRTDNRDGTLRSEISKWSATAPGAASASEDDD